MLQPWSPHSHKLPTIVTTLGKGILYKRWGRPGPGERLLCTMCPHFQVPLPLSIPAPTQLLQRSGHPMWRLVMVMTFSLSLDPHSGAANMSFLFFLCTGWGFRWLPRGWLGSLSNRGNWGSWRVSRSPCSSKFYTRIRLWVLPSLDYILCPYHHPDGVVRPSMREGQLKS